MGDKKGARLTYGGHFDLFDGETLTKTRETYDIPNMYYLEDKAFIESFQSGESNRNHIDRILESAKLLDSLYASAEKGCELQL